MDEGRLATSRGYALEPADRLTADIIERLMCDARADLLALCASHGQPEAPVLARAHWALTGMPGLGRLRDGVLSAASWPAVRLLAARMDPLTELSGDRFSLAS